MRFTAILSASSNRLFKGYRPLTLASVGFAINVNNALTAPFRPNAIMVAVSFLAPFVVLGLAPIPWQWTGDDRPKAEFFPGLVQALILDGIWIGLAVLLMWVLGPSRTSYEAHAPREVIIAKLGLGVFVGFAAVIFGRIWSEKEAAEGREKETAKLLGQSQAKALRNQLEPHVLYNALNGLSELIREDPLAAEDVVVRLAQLYRMLTHHGSLDRVSLGEERQLVEAYLAMEQMRLGDRLDTHWVWTQGDDHVRIPPLFLQPLVENAIKHGVSPTDLGGRVVISYDRQGEEHTLRVANTGRAPKAGAPRGVGLGNLEARLALWPEAKGSLEFTHQGDWTYATVRWTPRGIA